MKTITLVKIAAVGGFITCSLGFGLQYKIEKNIKQMPFYKKSMNLVRHNKAAVYYLGEPIKEKTIDVFNTNKNFMNGSTGQYEVKLKGSKQNGVLHIFIEKGDEYNLKRLELAVDNIVDRKLLIPVDHES